MLIYVNVQVRLVFKSSVLDFRNTFRELFIIFITAFLTLFPLLRVPCDR